MNPGFLLTPRALSTRTVSIDPSEECVMAKLFNLTFQEEADVLPSKREGESAHDAVVRQQREASRSFLAFLIGIGGRPTGDGGEPAGIGPLPRLG